MRRIVLCFLTKSAYYDLFWLSIKVCNGNTVSILVFRYLIVFKKIDETKGKEKKSRRKSKEIVREICNHKKNGR